MNDQLTSLDADALFRSIFDRNRFTIKPGLDVTRELLKRLGNPQQNAPVLHVAGTNGKGSTASLVARILTYSNVKNGLFTSPHLIRFNERFALNGTPAPDAPLLDAFHAVARADAGERPATFFEYATAMACELFARQKVAVSILECGMGGRWDSTNVCTPSACAITTIGMDHAQFLGTSIPAIAAEKAGILKAGIPAVTTVEAPDALAVIRKRACEVGAPLLVFGEDFTITPHGETWTWTGRTHRIDGIRMQLAGRHQVRNTALALALLEAAEPAIPWAWEADTICEAIATHSWPARLQKLSDAPPVYLDGAHNPEAIRALCDFAATIPGPRTLVFGAMADKDIAELLAPIPATFDTLILTTPPTPRAMKCETLRDRFGKTAVAIPDPVRAVRHAIAGARPASPVFIAGSLYLAGAVLEAINAGRLVLPAPSR